MQYKHATLLLFIILIGTGILTVAVYERRQALNGGSSIEIGQPADDEAAVIEQRNAANEEIDHLNTRELTPAEHRSLDVDLDGDGTKENVSIALKWSYEFGITTTITVNGASDTIADGNGQSDGYFGIVDIDTSDALKEIAVGFNGPDGQESTTFYHWHDNALFKFGTNELAVGSWEDSAILGDGSIAIATRAMVLDTWFYNANYHLDGDTLVEVPQVFYTRLDQTNLITSLIPTTFQVSPTDIAVSVALTEGEEFAILGCDHIESTPNETTWCQAKDSKGNIGWFNADTINMQEDFYGFSFAD